MANGKYFAAGSPEEVASTCMKKSASFFNTLRANAYLDKLARMYRAYYGNYSDEADGHGHSISFAGEQGELVQLPINHFGNLARHIYVMVTSNRPVMEARAVNTDYKSQAQTYLANGILDYYMRERKLEDALKKATEMAIIMGSGFVKMEWNSSAGEIYDVDDETGETVTEGDAVFSTLSPFDVVVDGTKESWDNEWIIVRSFQNRYNLIAKYPELEQKLMAIPSKSEGSIYRVAVWSNDETDDIPVYEFYHKRTDAVPEGRYVLFCESDCVLLDAKLPYREIPVYRITAGDVLGTPYGYSPMFDVYPIQEGLNTLYSSVMSNQNAFAVQNIYVPRGADLSISSLDGALNIIEGNAKPESVQLTDTPAEVFKFIEMLNQAAETISGVNSVARGNPEASLKSGAALALVQSQAIQFISGLQQSYVRLIEDCGTSLINMLKDFAKTPKVIALVGKNNRSYLKEFTGEAISAINRVIVDVGNPLAKTLAGRVQMSEQLIQMGIVKNPTQYFQVLNTGRLDPMFEDEMDQFLLAQSENEKMLAGEPVFASVLDAHKQHIMDHRKVFSDPEMRKDPELLKNAHKHIQEHIDLLRGADPDLLQLLGEQPLNPPQGIPSSGQLPAGPMKNPTKASMQNSPMGDVMQPEQGLPQAGDPIIGQEGIENMPSIPQVPASALVNPDLQQQALGNVKQ
tara:strand:+ start:2388 stop:4445 length:2058 start_codon:yes stop_codon:yes gene_type:complete